MLLKPGDTLLVVHRRLFEADTSRYFIGTVAAFAGGLAKVAGQTFVRTNTGWIKKEQLRTKLVPLTVDGVMAYQLPDEVEVAALEFRDNGPGKTVLADGHGFEFDMTERPRAA